MKATRNCSLLALSLLTTTLALSFSVLAEEPQRGTLPDGRAFRTDESGNQLVDYIAELEVSVDSLERRIYGLQDELEAKNAALERVQAGGSAWPKIEERDLGVNAQNVSGASRVENLTAECNCAAQVAPLQASISTLRSELTKEKELHQKDIAFYEASLQNSKEPMTRCNAQISALEKNVQDLSARLASANVARERSEKTMAALKSSPQQQPLPAQPVYRSFAGQAQANATARERAVESVRSDVSGELTRLKMSVSTRDALFAQFDQRGKSMQIRPSPAISSRRKTISDISKEVGTASSVKELAALKRDVQEIIVKVNDDIALVRRLGRNG